MSRRRKGHGCGITVLVLLFMFIPIDGGLEVLSTRKHMPSSELADESRIFSIKDGRVALILDNQMREEKGIYEGGQVYLPMDWISEHLSQRFYQDEGEKLLVYALPDPIIYADESAQGKRGPLFKVTQDGTCLFLGVVVSCTDIRAQAFAISQIKRVFVGTSWQPHDTAVLKKTEQVRIGGGVKSQIITEAAAGETADVLETMEKWSRVRTSDGYIGYAGGRKLEAGEQVAFVSIFEAPVHASISMDGKVRLGFHQITRPKGNNTLENYVSSVRGTNAIVLTWFSIVSGDGAYISLANRDYVDKVYDMGLRVWAMVENVNTEEGARNLNTKTPMSFISTRKKLIEKLINKVDTYGFDGLNLNFESLETETGPHYVQFTREMSVVYHNKGLVLSADNYIPSFYTASHNRREQGVMADYVTIMGYDEHYTGGGTGFVSSTPYAGKGTENILKGAPKEKAISAIPSYTRVWTVNEGKASLKAYGISDTRQWVERNQVELSWDKPLGQHCDETVNGSGQQYIWMEEEDSTKLKIDLTKEFDLAGVVYWKLGLEPADIWDIASEVK